MNPPLLDARDLAVSFGGIAAVRGVELQVGAGETRCIIGPNGAGKSSVLNMLSGTVRPNSGRIVFRGRDMVGLPVEQFARMGIARKFQVPSLFDSLSVRSNLDVAMRRAQPGAKRSPRIAEMLERLELAGREDEPARSLSHGQKQWLEIGLVLMAEPALILLDEPTAGMGPQETQRTASLLKRLQGEAAIIVIEHDMNFVRALACPTLVMHQGRIIAEGLLAEIERDDRVRDVYLGRR